MYLGFLFGAICGLFCDLLANFNYLLARSALSTHAQSKIEFAAHLIKISSQIAARVRGEVDLGCRFYILLTQRCWLQYIFHIHKNGRRNIVRRYVLGSTQSEDMFINVMRVIRDKYYNVKINYCK